MEVGFQDENQPGYYEGQAHLLEHAAFLNETPEMRALFTGNNAFTSAQFTGYQLSASSEKFVEAFAARVNQLYNFRKYPNIKDEVSAVNNE